LALISWKKQAYWSLSLPLWLQKQSRPDQRSDDEIVNEGRQALDNAVCYDLS
jgi:hypothetical protein